jgi:hypothetical protein
MFALSVNSLHNIAEMQERDAILHIPKRKLTGTISQTEQQQLDGSPWRSIANQVGIENGVLRRTVIKEGHTPYVQILLPPDFAKTLLKHIHDDVMAGHLGLKRTLERARQRFFYPGMSKDIREYVRKCDVCASAKQAKPDNIAPLHQEQTFTKFGRIAMDFVGPFPTTKNGNKYILVISDYFTKWVEAFPTKDQTAMTVVDILDKYWIPTKGCPQKMHSDKGSAFISKIMTALSEVYGIEKTTTTSYHPMSNGLVERFNQTMEKMFRCFVNENQAN